MKKSTMKMIGRIASVILSAVFTIAGVGLLPQLAMPVQAVDTITTYTINDADVDLSFSENGTIQINGNGSATDNTISIDVASGKTVTVNLNNVNIDVSNIDNKSALRISGAGNVTVELIGSNTLKSGINCAGLQNDSTGTLTISGNGSLTATGGLLGAGIGGGFNCNGSNIVISGGTVTATGGSHGAAGIGGGSDGDGSDIYISGGTVTAIGGYDGGAGIGGGYSGNGTNIVISGGTVTAKAGLCYTTAGAGIGGGGNGDGTNIVISGGTVTAIGGYAPQVAGGAGIGGGQWHNGANISISGGVVYAVGGSAGAGIGGGNQGSASGITISESANLFVAGGADSNLGFGAAIGSGGSGQNRTGAEFAPNVSGLTTGSLTYYPSGTTFSAITGGTVQPTSTTTGSHHAIAVNTSGNGSASASATHAASGTDITLTVNPGNGYIFKEWQVYPGNVTITNNSFTMPDEAVTVTAVFEADPRNPAGPSAPTVVYESEPETPVNYMQEVEDKITEAINLGGTRVVRIEGYPTLSYHVLEMLKNHRDITLVSEFTYDGLEYRMTIPGSAVKLDPSINWYGPKYLFPMFYMYGTDTLPAVQAYLEKYES